MGWHNPAVPWSELERAIGAVGGGRLGQRGALFPDQPQCLLDEDIGAQHPLVIGFQAVVLDQDGRHMGGRAPAVREPLAQPAVRKARAGVLVVDAEHQLTRDVALRLQRRIHRRL